MVVSIQQDKFQKVLLELIDGIRTKLEFFMLA